jgi:outer membrane protein assembly factor BamA
MNVKNVSAELENEIHDASGTSHIIGMVSTLAYKVSEESESGDVIKEHLIKLSLMPSYSNNGMYTKAVANALKTINLGKNKNGDHHTLSGRITLGYASDNTPFYEKFYAGGMSTIRGYSPRSITPSGSVAGGKYLTSANLTYSFPIVKNLIKGVIFVEAANVSNSIKDFSTVKVVGGMGLKANLKQSFLRSNIEAGFVLPMFKKENDQFKPFYFMMGNYDPAYDL